MRKGSGLLAAQEEENPQGPGGPERDLLLGGGCGENSAGARAVVPGARTAQRCAVSQTRVPSNATRSRPPRGRVRRVRKILSMS